MSDTADLLKETTDTLRSLLARGKETPDDGIRMILGPKGWRDTIDLIARADVALKK